MTASEPPRPDHRRRPRPRVAVSGQLLHGIYRETADVVVRNLTEDGAKVRLTAVSRVQIAGPLVLRIATVDRACVVTWRSGDELGLRFE